MGLHGTNAGWKYTDPDTELEVTVDADWPLVEIEAADWQRRYDIWSGEGTTRNITTYGDGVPQIQARQRFISNPADFRTMLRHGLNGVELRYLPDLAVPATFYPVQLVRIVEAAGDGEVRLVPDRDRGRSHGEYEVGVLLRRIDGGTLDALL